MRRATMAKSVKAIFVMILLSCLLAIVIFQLFLPHSLLIDELLRNSVKIVANSCENELASDSAVRFIDQDFFIYLTSHLRDTPYDGIGNYTRYMIASKGLKPIPDAKAVEPGMGSIINDVTSFQYAKRVASCRPKAAKSRSVFVAIISAPENFERRIMIRQTWLNHFKDQTNDQRLSLVGYAFVIGKTDNIFIKPFVETESENLGDILQVDMLDNYHNISIKVAGLMNWVNINCPKVDFMLKVDDDVYVNVHNLATVLHSLSPSERNLYGLPTGGYQPPRNEGKNPSSFENWPWLDLPFFFHGAGVIIGGKSIRPLLAGIQTTPFFIWDDVYLTGLCAAQAKVQLMGSNKLFVISPKINPDPCFVRESVMWQTRSAVHMNVSHNLSHNLYRNETGYCILHIMTPSRNGLGVEMKSNVLNYAANASEFHFQPVIKNKLRVI